MWTRLGRKDFIKVCFGPGIIINLGLVDVQVAKLTRDDFVYSCYFLSQYYLVWDGWQFVRCAGAYFPWDVDGIVSWVVTCFVVKRHGGGSKAMQLTVHICVLVWVY